ncbi:ferrous iron transport protein A [Vibrio xiamenensis]|uniref:Ferrous iron transport protein A n=1 Tax=Vibrio xiamenensis TaxID=861298 RepID=A0A1G8EMX7_9VIBR|nr:FeoA family protein [Vibrio xiamenensis]SDH71205.1 ferrous iron transport protein A [Vibrio xiamenensis]
MKLSQLAPGQSAVISGFSQMTSDVRKKLMIMGMLPDTNVTVLRKAPFGDPLQVEVRGVSLALRCAIANQIDVEVV